MESNHLDRTTRHRRASYIIGLLATIIGGCQPNEGVSQGGNEEPVEIPILRSAHGAHSHERRAMQLVIRDPATLAKVPIVDIPVNFDQEMLLVVTLGQVMSEEYAVVIDRVWQERSKVRVSTRVTQPSPGASPSIATPYCIAVVPRSDLNVAGFSATPPSRSRTWGTSETPKKW